MTSSRELHHAEAWPAIRHGATDCKVLRKSADLLRTRFDQRASHALRSRRKPQETPL